MVSTGMKVGVAAVMWAVIVFTVLAQTSPGPGPTVPGPTLPEKSPPLPKGFENTVLNPAGVECKAGWRPGLRWPREQFEAFCRQLEASR
jgi:hypothetical protein